MPWLTETNGTPTSVTQLLAQIDLAAENCTLLLSRVIAHRARCTAVMPNECAHIDMATHGQNGSPARGFGHTNLVNALASLQRVQAELLISSTEMSHGGMP